MYSKFNRNGSNYNNYGGNYGGGGRRHGCFSVIMLLLVVGGLIGGVVYLKHSNQLGAIKNKYVHTPKEDVAIMTNGMDKAHQTDNDINEKAIERDTGRQEHLATDVTNKYLENDEIFDENNLYAMPQQYAVFFFSNTKKDNQWIGEIKKARQQGLKVYTFNANMVDGSDKSFIYRYYTRNYEVSKKSKEYGKVDGKKHPFMVLFDDHQPQKLIVKSSEEKALFQLKFKLQQEANNKANNYYLLENNGLGLNKVNWGNAVKKGKEIAQQAKEKAENMASLRNNN